VKIVTTKANGIGVYIDEAYPSRLVHNCGEEGQSERKENFDEGSGSSATWKTLCDIL